MYFPNARMSATKPGRYLIYKKNGGGDWHYTQAQRMLFYAKCEFICKWVKQTGRQVTNFHFSKSSTSCYMFIGNVEYRFSNHNPHTSFVGISFFMVWSTDIFDIIFGIIYETWKLGIPLTVS
jgi:hypothetical protein